MCLDMQLAIGYNGSRNVPEGTLVGNVVKGKTGMAAYGFGAVREAFLLRIEDVSAIRIGTFTDVISHKRHRLRRITAVWSGRTGEKS